MEHPLLFEPGDELVARVRARSLRLPEAVEILTHGRPAFKAGEKGRVFALVGAMMDRTDSVVFKPDPAESPALREDPRVFIPKYWGPSGWLGLDVDRAWPDDADEWVQLGELIETSFRQVALRRQLAVLDAVM
ncbi:MmcQ/YjbR family DNA-binding protein [Leifsonia aquatica]|uniref:MmcQ/YjbR family DNA-binding protein n=1 Tax=Leifsonia aquatica TaxID=144185 RepID=UPI000468D42C|nr:MmcQ/YjbR family DNA-binding protein [Leifsonia aquatica]